MIFSSILNPTIYVGSFEWREPVTTLTDFLVAMVCWTAFFLIRRYKDNNHPSFPWFKRYFLIFAIGMTSAAWLGHGLQAYVLPEMKVIGWICGATGILFLQIGSIRLVRNMLSIKTSNALHIVVVGQYLVAVICMFYFLGIGIVEAFKVTQINSVVGLIGIVLPLQVVSAFWNKVNASKIVVAALVYSAIPGIVYSNQLSINQWFNYHDISHVLMSIFMTIMFFGLSGIVKGTNSIE